MVHRDTGAEQELTADVVMDAMGRGAHTPAFLESLGYGRPTEDHIVMHTTYASQPVRMPPGAVKEMLAIVSAVPGRPTGMFLTSREKDTWIFTVFGMVGREPPRDLAGMLSFAQEYGPAHLLAAVRAAEPIGDAVQHRLPSSQWRRYDKMPRFPDGLLVCGDAICSFNPVHGVGMTMSGLNAIALRDCLRRGGTDLSHRYFRAAAKPIGVAWQMAAGSDLAFPEVEGRRSPSMRVSMRVSKPLADWILTACESDPRVAARFFKVNGLVDPRARLLHPAFICRVVAVNLLRRQRNNKPRHAQAAGRADSRAL